MAQAARQSYDAYDYARFPSRESRPARERRPDIRVIPGRRSENPALRSIAPELASAFKAVIAIIAIMAALCAVRVWFSASTVAMLEDANRLESALASAQATTSELEIQHSILASSARIEEAATNLGMVAPDGVMYLKVVIPGRIIMNPDGTVSLAGTIHNIEEYAASLKG